MEAGELTTSRVAWGRDEQRILVGDTVQTRRNDRRTDVENRAQWTVSDIHEDYVDLTSIDDCAQRRRISSAYALDHLQLAYASTVNGAQGETTDASIVGPDVDAAGLYVGLTRGRVHNLAIAVAPSHAAARARVADSMLRGITELTMKDAMQAAVAELRWAAKNRTVASSSPSVGADRQAGWLSR